MNTISVIIVDDEPPARRGIRNELDRFSEAKIIGEATNGEEAVEIIRDKKPDLVFLDIQMPLLNGMELVERIGSNHFPLVIFVTAYDQFAIDAFNIHAVDYLLKPIDGKRFEKAFKRAKEQLQLGKMNEKQNEIESLLSYLKDEKSKLSNSRNQMVIQDAGKISFLDYDEIYWIESSGNYVSIYIERESQPLLIRETMKKMESRLKEHSFLRIHRSKMVNLSNVRKMERQSDGRYVIKLRNGEDLLSSRRYKQQVKDTLSSWK